MTAPDPDRVGYERELRNLLYEAHGIEYRSRRAAAEVRGPLADRARRELDAKHDQLSLRTPAPTEYALAVGAAYKSDVIGQGHIEDEQFGRGLATMYAGMLTAERLFEIIRLQTNMIELLSRIAARLDEFDQETQPF